MFSKELLELAKLRKFEKPVNNSTHEIKKSNPLCGDIVHVNLEIEDSKFLNVSSNYESCALVHASLNYLFDYVLNKDLDSLKKVIDEFELHFMEEKESSFILNETELKMFNEIKNTYPSRKNCVFLPFLALKELF